MTHPVLAWARRLARRAQASRSSSAIWEDVEWYPCDDDEEEDAEDE